jgi:hypothetical protein
MVGAATTMLIAGAVSNALEDRGMLIAADVPGSGCRHVRVERHQAAGLGENSS